MSKTASVRRIGFTNYYTAAIQLALILGVVYFVSLHSYLLFHSLAELAGVIIGGVIFVVIWNTRRQIDSGYFTFLGIALLFVSGISLLHLLAYKGMGVFPKYDANLPTQLWIASRYLLAFSFLLAPIFLKRKVDLPLTIIFYSAALALLLLNIFYWKNFPVAYIEGQGFTGFKKDSEYIISFLFGVAALIIYSRKSYFDSRIRRLLIFSLIASVAAEISFTEYVSVYGFANFLGHLFLLISFYLLYLGIIEMALRRPSRILYRNLRDSHLAIKKNEAELRKINDTLEEKIRLRTYDLRRSNEELGTRNTLLKIAAETNSRRQYLGELVRIVKNLTGCESVGIRVLDEYGNIPYNSYSGFSQKFWESENWLSVRKDQCICTRVLRGRPDFQELKMTSDEGSFCCNDTLGFVSELSSEEKARLRGTCVKQGFMSLAVVPVWYGRKILGVIHIADKEKNKLSREKIKLVEAMSSLVGTAIHKYNTQDSLDKSKRALAVLSEGNHISVHSNNERELLDKVCGMIMKTGGYAMAWIGYFEKASDEKIDPVALAGIDKESLGKLIASSRDGDNRKGASVIVANTGEAYVRRNIQSDPHFSYLKDQSIRLNFKSSISLPLKNKRSVFGVINIYAKESMAFDRKEINLLEELADDLSFGINSIRMREAKERSERQLVKSYQHLGMINRKISVLVDLGKDIKNTKNMGDYILKTAINISRADLGLLYKFDSRGNFNLLSSQGVGKRIDKEMKFFNGQSHKFLKPLVERQKKLEVRSEMYNLGCFTLDGKVHCYLIIPLSKKKSGRLKGAIFLGYLNEKKLFEQELEFFDVFERHASAALFTAKVL